MTRTGHWQGTQTQAGPQTQGCAAGAGVARNRAARTTAAARYASFTGLSFVLWANGDGTQMVEKSRIRGWAGK